ncbi:hypothetical protein A3Q56_00880 [Intoshia linei]|uniref:Ubiquitin fusion degradation protein UFD1 N-terminal subdomain 1 domain-containing protein n=1 Tax=Intoshia linei TaxID=1819745 RepID=A0A177BAN1_9BILA|nr:hypothetical protein A3Q56_00880 [Intoshia linei]
MHSIFGSLINAANMFRQFDNFSNEFHHKYRAYSVTMFDGYKKVDEVNCGGKIIMPNSALEQLLQLNIQYPMLFSISNEKEDNYKVTHCGVLEFVSKEGIVYLPHWVINTVSNYALFYF